MAGIKAHTHVLKAGSKAALPITRQIPTVELQHQATEQVLLPTEEQVLRLLHPGSRAIPVPEGNPLPPPHGRQQARELQEDLKQPVRHGSQPAQPLKGNQVLQEQRGNLPEPLPKEDSLQQVIQGRPQVLPLKDNLLQQVLHGNRQLRHPGNGLQQQVRPGSLLLHSRLARAEDLDRASLLAYNAPLRSHQ